MGGQGEREKGKQEEGVLDWKEGGEGRNGAAERIKGGCGRRRERKGTVRQGTIRRKRR